MATVVFVHGAWHGSWCWRRYFVPAFERRGHRCLTIDLPGHDRPGDRRRIWSTLGAYVEAVRRQIEAIDGPVVLVGHSMGGLVVQRLLETTTVGGAVLVASAPRRGVGGATMRRLRHDPPGVVRTVLTADMWPIVRGDEQVRQAFFTAEAPAEIVRWTAERLQNESYPAYLSMILRWPRPGRVRTPVLVVAAELDGIFTVAEQRDLARAYRTEAEVIAGAGHDLMLDERWEQAASTALDWIDGVLPPTGAS